MKYEELGSGVVKRRERRRVGLFIDGTGLDRATRRINRKVDLSGLVRGVSSGLTPVVARYYTLIPYEDDSRQRAFLEAVSKAGLTVIVKRLPPKGVSRQVSVDLEMAADIVAFGLGHTSFSSTNEYRPHEDSFNSRGSALPTAAPFMKRRGPVQMSSAAAERGGVEAAVQAAPTTSVVAAPEPRSIVVVDPSRELAYPIGLMKELSVDTTTADFGQFNTGDVLKSAAKWIDLSDSETIWRD